MTYGAIRVLVIDDSDADRELVRRQLMRSRAVRFQVTTADSAESGLAAIRKLQPDVVLLDHGMPVEDGFAVLRALDGDEAPPIILLTGREDDSVAAEALALGAWGYAPKSIITTPLIADTCLRAHLSRARVSLPAG